MKSSPKIVTIGSTTFDIFAKAHQSAIMHFNTPEGNKDWLCMEYGGKLTVDEVHETFGGGASNTAVGFARLGFAVTCLSKVGIKYGDRVIDNMRQEGIEVRHIKKTEKAQTGLSVILNSFEGERTVLYHRGANGLFHSADLPKEALIQADWIFLNHVSCQAAGIFHKLQQILKENPKVRLAWNPGHEQLLEGAAKWRSLLQRTEILFLNKEEAAEFSKKRYYQQTDSERKTDRHGKPCHGRCKFLAPPADDLREIFRELCRFGPQNVVITDGRNGAQCSDGKHLYYAPIAHFERVDSLGAGDAFATGFTAAIVAGKSLPVALTYGTLNSGNVVKYYGAQQGLMKAQQLASQLKKNSLKIVTGKL